MSRPYHHDEVAHRSHSHRNYDSLDSAFRNLHLNARDRRYPRSSSGSSVYTSPSRHLQSVGGLHHRIGTPEQGPLDLIPAQRRSPLIPRDLYRHGRPTPLTYDPPSLSHGVPSPGYGRYNVDRWPSSGASPVSRVSHHFSRQYRVYHDEDRLIDMQRFASSTDRAVLCNCRTCVEHRYPFQDWALIGHDHSVGREGPAYRGEVYPVPGSSRSPRPRRYLSPGARDDWVYADDDYYSPNYDSGVPDDRYAYPPDNLALNEVHRASGPMHLGRHYVDYRNSYESDDDSDRSYNGIGSDHEHSDNALYTGHERYDYSDDEYGEVYPQL
ncbi:hypothetical protein APHAL10511_001654 [Amanita phalloides]|nr:hypothetical protein APHAL10511_001654 [Amanita phalloides]